MVQSRIKLRQVETFIEIVRAGSLKGAAANMHLTQPAVSRALKELEQAVGATLLTRGRAGLQLTPQGQAFLDYADTGVAALGQAVRAVSGQDGGGTLSVGALPSVAARVLPRAVALFGAILPRIAITIEDGPHGYLMDRLRRGALDIVVGRLGAPDTMKAVSFSQLYMEHVVIVAAPDHALAQCAGLVEISGQQLVYPSKSAAIRPLVDRLFLSHGVASDANRVLSVSDAFGRGMCQTNGALWVISRGVVANDIDAGRLISLPIDIWG